MSPLAEQGPDSVSSTCRRTSRRSRPSRRPGPPAAGGSRTAAAAVAAADADEHRYFRIGKGLSSWTPDRAGELVCYANDLPFLYWNNFGPVTLELREL